jgi:hypothetical protein
MIFVLVSILGIAGFSSIASAGTIYTSPLWADPDEQSVAGCVALNSSSADVSVQLKLVDATGEIIEAQTSILAPGESAVTVTVVPIGFYHCRFTAQNTSKIRANLQIIGKPADGIQVIRAISEAR